MTERRFRGAARWLWGVIPPTLPPSWAGPLSPSDLCPCVAVFFPRPLLACALQEPPPSTHQPPPSTRCPSTPRDPVFLKVCPLGLRCFFKSGVMDGAPHPIPAATLNRTSPLTYRGAYIHDPRLCAGSIFLGCSICAVEPWAISLGNMPTQSLYKRCSATYFQRFC